MIGSHGADHPVPKISARLAEWIDGVECHPFGQLSTADARQQIVHRHPER